MTREDIRQFVGRDWARLAEAKARAWEAAKRTPAGDLRAANELRRFTRIARPDWPGTDEKDEDLRTHVRVSEALGAVTLLRSR